MNKIKGVVSIRKTLDYITLAECELVQFCSLIRAIHNVTSIVGAFRRLLLHVLYHKTHRTSTDCDSYQTSITYHNPYPCSTAYVKHRDFFFKFQGATNTRKYISLNSSCSVKINAKFILQYPSYNSLIAKSCGWTKEKGGKVRWSYYFISAFFSLQILIFFAPSHLLVANNSSLLHYETLCLHQGHCWRQYGMHPLQNFYPWLGSWFKTMSVELV